MDQCTHSQSRTRKSRKSPISAPEWLMRDATGIKTADPVVMHVSSHSPLAEVVEYVWPALSWQAATRGARLTLAITPQLPPVYVPREALAQSIRTLVLSAVWAAGEHGRVELHAATVPATAEIHLSVNINDRPGPAIRLPIMASSEPPEPANSATST